MPTQTGDEFRFPDGSHWVVEQAPDGDDGALVFRLTLPDGGLTPPPHRHLRTVESFEILEGSLSLQLNGAWRTLSRGDRVEVPVNTSHTLRNRSGSDVVIRNSHAPACHFDEFVAHVERLTRDRHITSGRDIRMPFLMSQLTLEYPETLVPGRPIDRVATRVFAGLGSMLGMNTRVNGR